MKQSPVGWTLLDFGSAGTVGSAGDATFTFSVLLALAGVGSAVVLGLALAALVRRRSRSYLLVTLALATLLARTGVAALTLTGWVADGTHHLLEHGLDVTMAALVVVAVYDARRVRRSADDAPLRSDGGFGSVESDEEGRERR